MIPLTRSTPATGSRKPRASGDDPVNPYYLRWQDW